MAYTVDSASHHDHQPSPIIFSRKLDRQDHLLHTVIVHLHANYQLIDTFNHSSIEAGTSRRITRPCSRSRNCRLRPGANLTYLLQQRLSPYPRINSI